MGAQKTSSHEAGRSNMLVGWHLTQGSSRRAGLLTGRTADDLKILYNDWPYGVEKGIVHLVVWTKFELDEDPVTGDLTDAMRKQIDDFVRKTFCSRVPPERVSILSAAKRPSTGADGWAGRLVQELEISQIGSRDRALPCHALQA